MFRKFCYPVLGGILFFAIPVAAGTFSDDTGKILYCGNSENPVCRLYRVCRPILDQYPEDEITEEGRECALTIENRRIMIRRKRTGGVVGYFYYFKSLLAAKISLSR